MSQPRQQQQYDFIITLKQRSFKGIDLVGYLLYILAILFFLRFFFEKAYRSIPDMAAAVLLLCMLIWKLRERSRKPVIYLRAGLALAAIALLVFHFSFWYLSLLYFAAAFLESYAKTPLEIGFSNDEVVINSLPRKRYGWKQIRNVILKDELLTIDFNNNRLIQQHTEPYGTAIEKEFNEFCRKKES